MREAAQPITRRQADALQFIRQRIELDGVAPSLREIGEHLGICAVSACGLVQSLAERGRGRDAAEAILVSP